MRRTSSGGGVPRAPSSLSMKRNSPMYNDTHGSRPPSTTPSHVMSGRPPISRNATPTTTAALLGQYTQQGVPVSPRSSRPTAAHNTSPRRRLSSLGTAVPPTPPGGGVSTRHDSPTPSSSASEPVSPSTSSASSPVQSRIIRRPPRYRSSQPLAHDGTSSFADDDMDDGDESETPAFMPRKTSSATISDRPRTSGHDLSATLRGDPRLLGAGNSQTSDSSIGSAAVIGQDGKEVPARLSRMPGPLSPRRTAELSGKVKGKSLAAYSSDGTPSMGSSYSDLDGEFSWVGRRQR